MKDIVFTRDMEMYTSECSGIKLRREGGWMGGEEIKTKGGDGVPNDPLIGRGRVPQPKRDSSSQSRHAVSSKSSSPSPY
jgi:hypothetical protein